MYHKNNKTNKNKMETFYVTLRIDAENNGKGTMDADAVAEAITKIVSGSRFNDVTIDNAEVCNVSFDDNAI